MSPEKTAPDFVDQYYLMNPQKEELLFDGHYLSDGMVVLIANPKHRSALVNIEKSPSRFYNALMMNRWAKISNVHVVNPTDSSGDVYVEFVATYQDETQFKHRWSVSESWFVDKSSLLTLETYQSESNRPVKVFRDEYFQITLWLTGHSKNLEEAEERVVVLSTPSTGDSIMIPWELFKEEAKKALNFWR